MKKSTAIVIFTAFMGVLNVVIGLSNDNPLSFVIGMFCLVVSVLGWAVSA